MVIYPPDLAGVFPVYSMKFVLTIQVSGAFLLIALTVVAMKAEEEKQILPAAGFTAQAISYGINVMSLFDIVDVSTVDQYESYYYLTVGSNFLLVPSTILIATYRRFKVWIRIYSNVAIIPLFASSIIFLYGSRDYHLLENINSLGVALVSISWLFWAGNIYMNQKRDYSTRD